MDLATAFTVLGGASGFAGLGIAFWAKYDSKKSNDIARDSRQLATESNAIAIDARDLAAEANEISLRTEQRDTESNRVAWSYTWPQPGVCEITNTGTDNALDVEIFVTADDENVRGHWKLVSGGGSVALRLEKLGEAILRNELEHENAQRRYEQSSRGPFGVPIERGCQMVCV